MISVKSLMDFRQAFCIINVHGVFVKDDLIPLVGNLVGLQLD